jgi:hypothetical protein
MILTRRFLMRSMTAAVLLLSAPVAFAQLGFVAKWVFEGIGAIAATLSISDYVAKWLQDKRCKVSVDDLENLKLQCQTVRNALDFEGIGAIPSLKTYLEKADKPSWVRAKIALGTFFNDGNGLMVAVNIVVRELGPETYPGPQEDIKRLYGAIDAIRAAAWSIALLPDTPEPQTVEIATSILKSISEPPLTSLAQNAIDKIQLVIDDRRKVSCS